MANWLYNYFFGSLHLEIEGERIEDVINQCVQNRIPLTNIKRTAVNKLSISLPLSHFREMCTILRRTNCSMRIKRKLGFPFLLNKLFRRSLFVAGMFVFIVLIYVASSVVWKVEVKGNEKIPKYVIMEAAEKAGLKPGALKYKLKNTGGLQKRMLTHVDGALLLLVDINGTRATVTVVEKVRPEKPIVKGPQNIVSNTEATIVRILAEKGTAQVKEGQLVRKGDILISGKVGDEQSFEFVESRGIVKGLVWMEANVVVPLKVENRIMTGEVEKRHFLQIGNKKIGLKKHEPSFSNYEVSTAVTPLKIGKWTLPLAWIIEKTLETDISITERSTEEAAFTAMKHARESLREELGENAEIAAEKVLHQNVENGKVYIKIQFDVIRDIGIEQPIIQGEDAIDN